ncbi:Calcium-dependent lipid-binding (CaLB domain) family protein [Rhynchospora pubera]|uniref:Calcium-dependent lipid-binding (CaLB domain) family protein n=1 Tax=Rhynchospora pubera TaxID=906938 RepID=A0AAV8GHE9_9POAL|nr:Calcium-dependent lipid-binding (CaLB domain) family protein [Rhynchospora pubera]
MEYKGRVTSFVYDPTTLHEADEGEGNNFLSLLDIYVHEALNLHNICIYANQDVYAKFSLTSSPDEALSTRVVASGGNSPRFEERLPPLRIAHPSDKAVLKVEIWMLSCAKTLLGDQLLGFTLIPISSISSTKTGKASQEFTLSSTDLFHSPAGTIRLTLTLNPQRTIDPVPDVTPSITSEVVILDPVVDYSNIEFPDVNAAQENQKMVMQYFDMGVPAQQCLPFIQLTPNASSVDDSEMITVNSTSENSMQNPTNFTGSTTSSFSNDNKISVETFNSPSPNEVCHVSATSPDTPTSKEAKVLSKDEATSVQQPSVFKSPLENLNLVEQQSEMQKQIMDMYMKSMQQFTESLAKMKLPMDIDKAESDDTELVNQSQQGRDNNKLENKNDGESKKDGSRVFYGSRAFF